MIGMVINIETKMVERDMNTWTTVLVMSLDDHNNDCARMAVREIEYIISEVCNAWSLFEEVPIRK